eukprot:4735734-Pleurochrysis_carterae.AAC.2
MPICLNGCVVSTESKIIRCAKSTCPNANPKQGVWSIREERLERAADASAPTRHQSHAGDKRT